ncbi:MAG: hypothetical protein ACOVOW_11965 [Spirosomataceae bacterium]|jgi:hypothetical protein
MKLTHNFDTIEINDDKIEFYSMVGVSKKENWSLLLENVLTYKSGSQKTVIIPEEIIEFQFSIFDYFNKGTTTQGAVIYYVTEKTSEPQLLLSVLIRENEIQLSSKTKSYEFANEILKAILHKYHIPFSYKQYIETSKEESRGYLFLLFLLFYVIMAILLLS